MKTFNQFQESVATLGLKAGSKFVLPALMAGIGAAGTIMQMGRPRKDGSTNDKKNVRSDILDDLMKKQKEVENIRKNKEKYTGRVDPTRGQTFKRTTFDKPTTVKPENEFHTNVDPNKDISNSSNLESQNKKIPRNSICPLCDSGKKYKHCCGKL